MNTHLKTTAPVASVGPSHRLICCIFASSIMFGSAALAQSTSYIGYVYPAGGQQGTTFGVKLGGQRLSGADQVLVTGEGITATIERVYRRLSNQDMGLLRAQLNELRKKTKGKTKQELSRVEKRVFANVENRLAEYCNRPASTSIADLVFVDITIAADAQPGPRELRVVTEQGVTNPLVFHVGQLPEVARQPMLTSRMQVLGKEGDALRKRPSDEAEVEIQLPCTVNGQVASGEVNTYRFRARKGQRLVVSCAARELIPFIADAVPGWFQPVISVLNSRGDELTYNDDFGFKPDPTLLFEVPADGEYQVRVFDAIYRGREDFVYRISIGELPLVTSIFPLGGTAQTLSALQWQGWNVAGATLRPGARDETRGIQWVTVEKDGLVSNRVPFLLSDQTGSSDNEPNNALKDAQKVTLPAIVDGRIDAPGDGDVFKVDAVAGETIVAEVMARRLDSPLDSFLKITDQFGNVIAVNDDHADVGSGLNTHHADSYVMFQASTDGPVFVHLGDMARAGGDAFAYRLRISHPQPDFELRVAPSGVAVRGKSGTALSVYAIRRDGYDGDIRIELGGAQKAFSMPNVVLKPDRDTARLRLKTSLRHTDAPLNLAILGRAATKPERSVRRAVPADDRMQAFLWRHLVPAQSLTAVALRPKSAVTYSRAVPPPIQPDERAANQEPPLKFSKQQLARRLTQLRGLFEEWLLTNEFYNTRVAECEAVK
ncbi:MAG: hypothetical protein GY903_31340 [Fuerstiella sp.]|nr:hypothetical protein [Fuerstiella sp.]MCP4858988.1 hypothetical protein [Fuerstiella sp.]